MEIAGLTLTRISLHWRNPFTSIGTCGSAWFSICFPTHSNTPCGVRSSVRLSQTDGHAVLAVRDTGIGIPTEAIPRLFDRFYRVEGAQGRTHEGTGIGLALVHELVKLHSGNVSVESEIGQGTTFTIRLPLGSAICPRTGSPPSARCARPFPRRARTYRKHCVGCLTRN